MRIKTLVLLSVLLSINTLYSQSGFFTENWVEYEGRINNNRQEGERTRVSDRGMSTHPEFSSRYEAQVNGLALVMVKDTISQLVMAELICEMWGGHPRTANKRFQINGGKTYSLPSEKTAVGNCEYLFPTIKIAETELVIGTNANQFTCDRGETFWGHFLLEEIGIRCYYRPDAQFLKRSGLTDFRAVPKFSDINLSESVDIYLKFDKSYEEKILRVHYFGYYKGYDWNGSGKESQWHGYQFKRNWNGHIGTVSEPPYRCNWDTRMIPDQDQPMGILALVEFNNGIKCWSDVSAAFNFPSDRPHVKLIYCSDMPVPFWSRDGQLKKATFKLPGNPEDIEESQLYLKIWDGGEGDIKDPFKLSGIPYRITSGNSPHDLVCTINEVDPASLKKGSNEIELISDTEHHGIEVCLPGPALVVRYKKYNR